MRALMFLAIWPDLLSSLSRVLVSCLVSRPVLARIAQTRARREMRRTVRRALTVSPWGRGRRVLHAIGRDLLGRLGAVCEFAKASVEGWLPH